MCFVIDYYSYVYYKPGMCFDSLKSHHISCTFGKYAKFETCFAVIPSSLYISKSPSFFRRMHQPKGSGEPIESSQMVFLIHFCRFQERRMSSDNI